MAKAKPCERCGTANPTLVCDFCGGCAECASRVEDGKRKCLACIRKDNAGPDWRALAARLAEALEHMKYCASCAEGGWDDAEGRAADAALAEYRAATGEKP